MKKFLTLIGSILIIIGCYAFYLIESNLNNKSNTEKIIVADTALTSRTYMISYKQYISK